MFKKLALLTLITLLSFTGLYSQVRVDAWTLDDSTSIHIVRGGLVADSSSTYGIFIVDDTGADSTRLYDDGTNFIISSDNPVISSATQQIGTGAASTNMTLGLFIKQGLNDDEAFALASATDVDHTFSAQDSSIYATFQKISSTSGGLRIRGLSDGDATALRFQGFMDSTNPTDATPAIQIVAGKSDGAAGEADLGALETVLRIDNFATPILSLLGNGDFEVDGDISSDGAFTLNSSGNNTITLNIGTADVIVSASDGATVKDANNDFEVQATSGRIGLFRDDATDSNAPSINFMREQSSGAVTTSASLGILHWRGNDGGNNLTRGAKIEARVEGFVSANQIPTEIQIHTARGVGADDITEIWAFKPSGRFEQTPVNFTLTTVEDYYGLHVQPGTITEFTSGENTDVIGSRFSSFAVTNNGATIINLATVYVENAPTGTATATNGPYSIFVDAGMSRFDGNMFIGSGTITTNESVLNISDDAMGGASSNIALFGIEIQIGGTLDASKSYAEIIIGSSTVVLDDIETHGDVHGINISTLTITETTTSNITNSASLYIQSAPNYSGSDADITNGPYQFFADGTEESRFDGDIGDAVNTVPVVYVEDVNVGDDILLADASVVGITGNEVITFLAAGSINFTGATVDVDGAFTASSMTSDAGFTSSTANTFVGDQSVDGDLDFLGAQAITTTAGDVTINSAGQTQLSDQVVQQTNVIRAVISKTGLTDATATGVFTVTTTDEAGSTDGGVYSVKIHAVYGELSNSDPNSAGSGEYTFARFLDDAGTTGANTAVVESFETSSAGQPLGVITVTTTETSEYVINVLFDIDVDANTPDVMLMIELIYDGFLTAPVIAVI